MKLECPECGNNKKKYIEILPKENNNDTDVYFCKNPAINCWYVWTKFTRPNDENK